MNFLGHPWQIWAAALIAVSVKITMPGAPKSLTSRFISVFVALLSGVILYLPVAEMLGWGASMHVPIAIIISLTAENLMQVFAEYQIYYYDGLENVIRVLSSYIGTPKEVLIPATVNSISSCFS